MSEPTRTEPVAGTGCCATATTVTIRTEDAGVPPCCGTAEAAADAGTCCDPAAESTAVTAGATCC
jgi:hypothetical protein